MPLSIQIKNPRTRELVADEMKFGAGRNATEAAENLIEEAAEMRRLRRALQGQEPASKSEQLEPSAA